MLFPHRTRAACSPATDADAAAGATDITRRPGRDFVREHRDCLLSYPRTREELEQSRRAKDWFFAFDWGEAVHPEFDGIDADVGLPYAIAYQVNWLPSAALVEPDV